MLSTKSGKGEKDKKGQKDKDKKGKDRKDKAGKGEKETVPKVLLGCPVLRVVAVAGGTPGTVPARPHPLSLPLPPGAEGVQEEGAS